MSGRDPDEEHRAATPLELLFDLSFVVAFGLAADELAHYLAEDHIFTSVIGFGFAAFAISWAWINFSWFASAYDTDDWVFRALTMIQMAGVLIFALGIPDLFDSIDAGGAIDCRVMVGGYVVMRVALVAQWARAAMQDPDHRATARAYIVAVLIAQVGWVALAVAQPEIGPMLACAGVLILFELLGPYVAETRHEGTPWHPHHIAERFGLLVIITLGEALLGTIAALSAIVGPEGPGWSVQAGVIAVAGVALTFGMWWVYFVLPCGEVLAHRRERGFRWGYIHIPVFAAIVAAGAGLHAAAYLIEHHTELSEFDTLLTTAIPVAAYVIGIFVLYTLLTGTIDRFHYLLIAVSAAVVGGSLALSSAGLALEWCLLVLAAAPWVTVVGYELRGHEHNARVLEDLRAG